MAASGGVDEDMSESVADCSLTLRAVHSDRVKDAMLVTDHINDIEIHSDSDDGFVDYLSLENDSDSSEDCD